MRRRVEITNLAQSNIVETLDWTLKHFGEQQRRRYQSLIRNAIKDLQSSNNDYRLRARPDLHPDARVYPIARAGTQASHYFVIRFFPDNIVVIGRLLHEARDFPRQLPEDFEAKG